MSNKIYWHRFDEPVTVTDISTGKSDTIDGEYRCENENVTHTIVTSYLSENGCFNFTVVLLFANLNPITKKEFVQSDLETLDEMISRAEKYLDKGGMGE